MSNVPTVPIHAYNRIKKNYETLKKLLNGEWADTDAVQEALGISFSEGMKMFDFGRMVAWNRPPLNGQRIVTKFRICDKTIKEPKVFWCEEDDIGYASVKAESNKDTHQWELCIEDYK